MKLPILGICRGAQILNVAFGGGLVDLDGDQELREIHYGVRGHPVEIEEGSLLSKLMRAGKVENVTSYHRQAVGRLGEGVRAVARSPEGTVEAIEVSESEDEWTIAVQWHPEMTVRDELQFGLVKAFVEEARRRTRDRRKGGMRQGLESGAARTRTWNQRIMSPVRTLMDLRQTCNSV